MCIWHYCCHYLVFLCLSRYPWSGVMVFVFCCVCPLFSVLSNPCWLRQMATLPESGSARHFFLLRGSHFSPQSPHARSGWGIGPKRSMCNLLRNVKLSAGFQSFKSSGILEGKENHLPYYINLWGLGSVSFAMKKVTILKNELSSHMHSFVFST